MFSADNQDSELDNQNFCQSNNADNQSHSTSKTESLNQSEDDLCPDCAALDPGEQEAGEENSFVTSHDPEGKSGTIIRRTECRHSSKERSVNHTRRKEVENRQLGFPYSVIKCKYKYCIL